MDDNTIQYLKDSYNGHKILYVRFSNKEFIFRSLGLKEYKYLLNIYSHDKFKLENAICNLSCVYPDSYDFSECEFGVLPTVIAGYITKISDFNNINDIFNEYDLALSNNNLQQQCMDLIKAFIKDYTYEEMEEWTWEKLMQMTVRAERIAKYQGFDYHIQKNENYNPEQSINNPEDIKILLNNKINPILYFKDQLEFRNLNMVDEPFIIGNNWNNKEILDAFRKQKTKQ